MAVKLKPDSQALQVICELQSAQWSGQAVQMFEFLKKPGLQLQMPSLIDENESQTVQPVSVQVLHAKPQLLHSPVAVLKNEAEGQVMHLPLKRFELGGQLVHSVRLLQFWQDGLHERHWFSDAN